MMVWRDSSRTRPSVPSAPTCAGCTAMRRGTRDRVALLRTDEDEDSPVSSVEIVEHEALREARSRAEQVGPTPSPELASLLRWVALQRAARTVVAIGSAGGVTGLALLDGMPERSVLTSIERDAHRHELARSTYEQAGVAAAVRAIQGDPRDVLGRLSNSGYDLCVSHDTVLEPSVHLDEVVRLLRPGGVLVAAPLGDDEAGTVLLSALAADERFESAVLSAGAGVGLASLVG